MLAVRLSGSASTLHSRAFQRSITPRGSNNLGSLDTSRETALHDSLRCGDLANGVLRVHCPDCGHHYLLPFTCKRRGCCPSCHQRRALDTATFIRDEVCLPVPHRHWVFTLPRILRNVFRKDPHRLTELCHLVADTLQDWLREQSAIPDGRVGIVLAIHTFGEYLAYHPHIHCLATAGVFDSHHQFHLISGTGCRQLSEIFRHVVLHRLLELKWISPRQADKLHRWKHHGFNIDQGEAAVGADDGQALERLAQYFLRAPVSLQEMSWNAQTKTVLYRSSRNWHTKRNFEIFSGPDFVAALYEHTPPKGFQTLRYYGIYSNKLRGMRKENKMTKGRAPCPHKPPGRLARGTPFHLAPIAACVAFSSKPDDRLRTGNRRTHGCSRRPARRVPTRNRGTTEEKPRGLA
ncbi:MAG: IS91 family transposase [Opitutales bacterium]